MGSSMSHQQEEPGSIVHIFTILLKYLQMYSRRIIRRQCPDPFVVTFTTLYIDAMS